MHDTLQRLFRYKAWANDELLTALAGLGGESPITGLAIKALSHSYIVDRIFAAHLRRMSHAYTSANASEKPTLDDLSADIRKSDREYIDYVSALDGDQLAETDRLHLHGRRHGPHVARGDTFPCDHPRHRSSRAGQRRHAAKFRSTGERWIHDLSA